MKVAVIGSGAWGTALALVASRAGHEVTIWSRKHELVEQINLSKENSSYLPGIALLASIKATNKLLDIIDYELFIIAIPAQSIRQLCLDLKELGIASDRILLICSKGIEQISLKLMSEVAKEILPKNQVAILSGPNFAHEVALDLPAITSIAADNLALSQKLAESLSNINFRIYPSSDIIAVQVFGAAKNVLAIATGITIGKELGENAKASIVSRGIFEINALSLAMGGRFDTVLVPAGVGDVHLTCSSATSRNTALGIALAHGKTANNALAEGFYTAKSINFLAEKMVVEMPICRAIYKIIHENLSIDSAINELLKRSIKK